MIASKNIVVGLMGAFVMSGVDVINLDLDNEILTIAIPKDSYEWHIKKSKIKNPEDYAKSIKKTWHDLGIFKNGKVRYMVKDIFWTKEMSDEAYKNNMNNIVGMKMW